MTRSMRRWLPAGAALVLFLSSAPALAATGKSDTAYTTQEALALAEHLFAVPAAYKLMQESYNSSVQQGQPSYAFSFGYTSPDNQSHYIDVTIGATTGTALSYSRDSAATGFVYPLPVSQSKAKALALAWAKRLYPGQLSQVSLQPLIPQQGALTQPVSYTFNFTREVQGIPAPFDGFSLTIDQNGRLIQASDNWTQAIFANASSVIGKSRANAIYAKALHLYLGYSTVWSGDAQPSFLLTYQSPSPSYPTWWGNPFGDSYPIGTPVISATNGEILSVTGGVVTPPTYAPLTPLIKGGPAVYPADQVAHWTEAQALAYARRVLQVGSARLSDRSESQSLPSGDVMYSFTFGTSSGRENATVDATSGYLSSVFGDGVHPVAAGSKSAHVASPTQAQLDAQAAAFIKRAFPHDTGGLGIGQEVFYHPLVPGKGLTTTFSFEPIVSGVPMIGDSAQLNLNPKSGALESFWTDFPSTGGPLPNPAKAITSGAATNEFVEQQPLALTYLMTQPSSSSSPQQVVLTYAPVSTSYGNDSLNAMTGDFVNPNANPAPYAGVIHDLGGVSGAPQVELLVSHGLLSVSAHGNVHPESDMTRAQFVKLVVDALGVGQPITYFGAAVSLEAASSGVAQGSPAFDAVATAFAKGWLQQGKLFHPNAPITRSDAAQILVRALGYASVLNHPNIFSLPAKDAKTIPSDQVAADAIAYALGMLPLSYGDFHPTAHVTVAQAAVAVVAMVTAYSEGQQLFSSNGPLSSSSPANPAAAQ